MATRGDLELCPQEAWTGMRPYPMAIDSEDCPVSSLPALAFAVPGLGESLYTL